MGTIGAENYDMTKLLLDYGADPNAEYTGDPVWIAACEQGNTEILDVFMLEYGADLEYYGGLGMRQAIDYCNLDVIELLAQKGVKITEDLYQFSRENISSDHIREICSASCMNSSSEEKRNEEKTICENYGDTYGCGTVAVIRLRQSDKNYGTDSRLQTQRGYQGAA